MDPAVVAATTPGKSSKTGYRAGELGYRLQELFGIYGFGFGALRTQLGLGTQDFTNGRPTLQNSNAAYGSTRSFWDLSLGGLGDFPTPLEGRFGNIEFSELVRRFVPKERSGLETINPIPNTLGEEHPWLPGSNYFNHFNYVN